MRLQKYIFVLAAAFAIAGCDPEISGGSSSEDADAGSADFSSFVAIGDSLTAGYADGALYRHGQENSFPAIMALQFALVGGGEFDQPLMDDIMGEEATGSLDFGGIDLGRSDRLVLFPNDDPPVAPAPIMPGVSTDIQIRIAGAGMFNNMGVPGAKSFHALAPSYGELSVPAFLAPTANPYFARFASSDVTRIIDDVLAQVPTFFTLWLGNNDVLLYALDGADPTVSGESITPTGTFDGAFAGLIGALTASPNTKGILINVPDVAAIPYFTTVPYNAIPLDSATATTLNGSLAAGYNAVLDGAVMAMAITQAEADRRRLSYSEGQNPVLITDETLTDLSGSLPPLLAQLAIARPAAADDYIVLRASPDIGDLNGGQYGITVPLADFDVVTKPEKDAIDAARLSYNATIKAAADADPNLLFFDAEALLNKLNTTGIVYGSGGISSTFVQGGGFSADGVHPTARGYAVIANEIFKVINEGFGAFIPPVDPNQYTTVFYQ